MALQALSGLVPDGYDVSPKIAKILILEELARRKKYLRLSDLFPDSGPLSRDNYPQHIRFFELGAQRKTRAFIAGNRVGKTLAGGFEITSHLIGRYPDWWPGHRFNRKISAWVAGDTMETTRDIIQARLLGRKSEEGSGIIPADRIVHIQYRPNTGGAADYADIKTDHGGLSRLGFKSYDQGRRTFQGTEQDAIWLDEEPPDEGIRSECTMRLMTTSGLLLETFTPLKGLTPIILRYLGDVSLDGADIGDRTFITIDRACVMAGWDDAPHLSDEEKARQLSECEPHLKVARSKGIPSLGSGAIYPIPEEAITVDDFPIPEHFPRAYGLDVGWNATAAAWGAWDIEPEIPVLYVTGVYKRGQAEPAIHAAAIKSRGAWIPGVIDPASRGRSQKDGETLIDEYVAAGLKVSPAINAVEAGIHAVYTGLSEGSIKVFRSCQEFFSEYRIYRRDEKGKIVKQNDHVMDAVRYLRMSGRDVAAARPTTRASVVTRPTGWR
jgi:phage terminase large subunit-like protein